MPTTQSGGDSDHYLQETRKQVIVTGGVTTHRSDVVHNMSPTMHADVMWTTHPHVVVGYMLWTTAHMLWMHVVNYLS